MKKGMMICASLTLAVALCGLARAEEMTGGSDALTPVGWAVSTSGRVFKVSPNDEVGSSVLRAALEECKGETKERCDGIMTTAQNAVVVALHCRRADNNVEGSFLGASLVGDESLATSNAMARAGKTFNPDQECDNFFSSKVEGGL